MRTAVPLLALLLLTSAGAAAPPDFDAAVAPLLVRRCLDCHSGADPKGGLDLTRKAAVLANDGPVVPGKPDASELWKRVAADEMPPKKPLTAEEKQLLREWIAGGAGWGADPVDPFAATTDRRAGRDWWSLRPVTRPAVPNLPGVSNPVDAFVRSQLAEAK